MSNWDVVVTGDDLQQAKRERKKEYVDSRERKDSLTSLEADGWTLISEYKDMRFIKVRKPKPADVLFENKVWMLFYSMGYSEMNRDRTFEISYSKKDKSLTKQIDVFAFDGETALVVECKTAENPKTAKDFKTELESLRSNMQGISNEIRSQYGRGVKIKFIFATSNCSLGQKDHDRLKAFGIEHFDEETIDYYTELTQHLGSSTRYQLLAKLFAGTKIDNMIDTVPAIRGSMGGHTYYSFSIEPERLLKIGYVLHRSDANRKMMPTYQRVIKKSRLNQIREFVKNGGYFPNSVIISIKGPKRGLRFDTKSGDDASRAQLGILYLPKKYHSAYIIDGQHRLYGYADTEYAEKNTIPVVAFENLDQEEQIKLFMEINENQKAVPKNLRNTLSADLLWTSSSYSERRKALRLRIAETLGEDSNSPLYGHVLIGENKKTFVRCITMDSIEKGISKGRFLSTFDKNNALINIGQFDNGEAGNEFAQAKLEPFIKASFVYLNSKLEEEWNHGEEQQGLLTNNSGIQALLRVLSDIIDFLQNQGLFVAKNASLDIIMQNVEPLLDAIVDFYLNMNPELRNEIKTQYGSNGPIQHWRYLQKAIHDRYEDFTPDGYETWWVDNSKQYNEASLNMLDDISTAVILQVKQMLDNTGRTLPFKLESALNTRLFNENARRKNEGKAPLNKWDIFTLSDCVTLANEGRFWTDGLKDILTRPEQVGRKGGNKAAKLKWLTDMNRIRKSLNKSSYSVKQSEYIYICSIYKWLFNCSFDTNNHSAVTNNLKIADAKEQVVESEKE